MLRCYLETSGKPLTGDAAILIATTDPGPHLLDYHGAPQPEGPEPLTGEAVAQALKRYVPEAGLAPEAVTVHSPRHLGAQLYYAASGDVRATQRFLHHARLQTPSIYLPQLTGQDHSH